VKSNQCEPTHVACLTPPGNAALATLAMRGPDAWMMAKTYFKPRSATMTSLPDQADPGSLWLGKFGQELGDEVILTLKQMNPMPWIEIHCHGGTEVLRYLLELFENEGLQSCTWQEWTRRNTADPGQAVAAVELAHAPTTRTASILLDQYHGAFAASLVNLQSSANAGDWHAVQKLLEPLLQYAPLGRHLTKPWRVVIAGAPNVGKSSLANKLAGFVRNIVSPIPGTTRDVVTTQLAFDGWPVELADTAGIRAAVESVEGQGVEKAREVAAGADLCLWVLDGSATRIYPDFDSPNPRLIINKVDLPAGWDWDQEAKAIRVSAQTGEGIVALGTKIAQWLVPDPPPPGVAVPFTSAICDWLLELRQLLDKEQMNDARNLLCSEPRTAF
jgi:tRNA modification GTPase